MIFVDTNVLMYAVGRSHPLQAEAREFFETHVSSGEALVSSAEVLQELMHAYLPVGRFDTLDAALALAGSRIKTIWSVEPEDIHLARSLVGRYSALGARDLLHLACCMRHGADEIRTFDRALDAAFRS
jgi:uncharacterized protein